MFKLANHQSAALFIRTFLRDVVARVPELDEGVTAFLADDANDPVRTWRDVMNTSLPDSVKYAKAIARLQNGTCACCYNACEFNDATAITLTIPWLTKHLDAYKRSTNEEKRTLWDYVKQINKLVLNAYEDDIAPTPSRDSIHKNILEYKATRARGGAASSPDLSSTKGAFKMMVAKQFVDGLPASLARRSEDEWSEMSTRYATFLNSAFVDEKTPAQMCDDQTPALFSTAWPVIDEVREVLSGGESLTHAWSELQQINSITMVQNRVPKNMMRNIEAYAQDIAGQLMNGSMTFEDMSIEKIGQDVLTQCSQEDMKQLADNAEALMPTLSALQSTMMQNMSSRT